MPLRERDVLPKLCLHHLPLGGQPGSCNTTVSRARPTSAFTAGLPVLLKAMVSVGNHPDGSFAGLEDHARFTRWHLDDGKLAIA